MMLPLFGHSYEPDLQTLKKPKTLVFNPQALFSLHPCAWLLIIIFFQIFILMFITRSPPITIPTKQEIPASHSKNCESGLIYVYNLPSMYNKELLDKCHDLDPWHSRCNAVSNHGFGRRATELANVVPKNLAPAWYWTDMYSGEIIYHTRILKYKCRTMDPELATAFYIPFYAGIAVGKYLFVNSNARDRDWHIEMLLKWVQNQTYWNRLNGSDHLIMLGRPTWDYRRSKDSDWGTSFINMPLVKKLTRLSVERSPWDNMEVSVPWPTGFHPRSHSELDQWLNFVRIRQRKSLFTFVGGVRKSMKNDFRSLLLSYCYNQSDSCRVVDCDRTRCHDGLSEILEAFLDSDFCLQPRGDTYTRRAQFDCMLAGSIPVFFWKRSVYDQYEWFLPGEPESFSVFIDQKDVRNGSSSIRRVLESYSREEVRRMREKVIEFIPNFVYGNPNQGFESSSDAFDISMEGVLRRLKTRREVR